MKWALFIIMSVLFMLLACDQPPASRVPTNNDTFKGFKPPAPLPQLPPSRLYGSDTRASTELSQTGNNNNNQEKVYIFKYSGRYACRESRVSLEEMEYQLRSIGIFVIHNKYESTTDGQKYKGECDKLTNDINVYVINRSQLIHSENMGGFCECTPDEEDTKCVPYQYATPPSNDCI